MTFRIGFRLFASLLLAGLATIVALLAWNQGAPLSMSSPVVAMVAAVAALFGLVVGKLADLWLQQETAEENRREMCAALCEEIIIKLERQSLSFAPEHRKTTFDHLVEEFETMSVETTVSSSAQVSGAGDAAQGVMPPVPASLAEVGEGNLVFDAVKGQIFKLPRKVVGPTVRYYTLDAMLDTGIKATQDAEFQRISPGRRSRHWNNVYKLAQKADDAGRIAAEALARGAGSSSLPLPTKLNYLESEQPESLRNAV